MLNRDVDEIMYNDKGEAIGVKSGNEMARAKFVVGDPSYFPKDKVKATGQIVRCICFLNHPIPNCGDSESVQIIIPGPQVNRKNDIFVCSIASSHNVSARGVYIAIVSTKMEGDDADREVVPGLALLGHIMQRFTMVATTYEPAVRDMMISATFHPALMHLRTLRVMLRTSSACTSGCLAKILICRLMLTVSRQITNKVLCGKLCGMFSLSKFSFG